MSDEEAAYIEAQLLAQVEKKIAEIEVGNRPLSFDEEVCLYLYRQMARNGVMHCQLN